jgi:hypothetical protein
LKTTEWSQRGWHSVQSDRPELLDVLTGSSAFPSPARAEVDAVACAPELELFITPGPHDGFDVIFELCRATF